MRGWHPCRVSGTDDHALGEYLSEVRGLPLLARQREDELLPRARAGDESAKRELVEGYLELSAMLATRLGPEWMRPLDAIQEANVVMTRVRPEGARAGHRDLGAPRRTLRVALAAQPPVSATVPVIPFYGAEEPELFAIERLAMDRPGRVIAALDRLLPTEGLSCSTWAQVTGSPPADSQRMSSPSSPRPACGSRSPT
jgi:hypothetical protein